MDTLGFNSEVNLLASAYSASTPPAESPPLPSAPAAKSPTSTAAACCPCCQQWDNAKKDPILNKLSAVLQPVAAPPPPPAPAPEPEPEPEPEPLAPTWSVASRPAPPRRPLDPEEAARLHAFVANAFEKLTAQPGEALTPTLDQLEKSNDDQLINLAGFLRQYTRSFGEDAGEHAAKEALAGLLSVSAT